MVTTRFEIIQNIMTTLIGIEKGIVVQDFLSNDYTYQITPRVVSDDFEVWDGCQEYPSFFVNSGPARLEALPSRRYRMVWDVQIVAYAKNDKGLEEIISAHVNDILIAMHQDIRRGRLATQTLAKAIDVETRMVRPYGWAELTFEIVKHFHV